MKARLLNSEANRRLRKDPFDPLSPDLLQILGNTRRVGLVPRFFWFQQMRMLVQQPVHALNNRSHVLGSVASLFQRSIKASSMARKVVFGIAKIFDICKRETEHLGNAGRLAETYRARALFN